MPDNKQPEQKQPATPAKGRGPAAPPKDSPTKAVPVMDRQMKPMQRDFKTR